MGQGQVLPNRMACSSLLSPAEAPVALPADSVAAEPAGAE